MKIVRYFLRYNVKQTCQVEKILLPQCVVNPGNINGELRITDYRESG